MKTKRILASLILGLGLTLALLWLLTAGGTPLVYAATYSVTNTDASGAGSLRRAILDANGNPGPDTITFNVTGTIVLTGALPSITGDLTIAGPDAAQLAVSGDDAYRVFSITNGVAVTITGLTVQDGSAADGGGVWSAGALRLDGIYIISNTASNDGGGLFVHSGSAMLSGTWVLNNTAGGSGSGNGGGGVYVYTDTATLEVNGGEISSNSASSSRGGGVYIYAGSATLSGTQLLDNSSAHDGGGMFINYGSATLTGAQVLDNSAPHHDGGGVYVYQSSATLEASGSRIAGNSALDGWSAYNSQGGGVFINYGRATLSGTQVLSNAADYGGGVYVYRSGATLDVSGGEIGHNSASYSGLDLYGGGGVFIWQGSATLSGTRVFSNSAHWGGGGGVHVYDGSATLSGTQVLGNAADYGGGVYVDQSGATLEVSGGEISRNSTGYYDGGGMYVWRGRATLSGTQVVGNTANRDGGGLIVIDGSATLNGALALNNTAGSNGGGVHVWRGRVILTGTQMLGNTAGSGGGAYLHVSSGDITVNNSCIVYNSDTAIYRNDGTLDASDNWWGSADGPSGAGPGSGDSVSTNVNYANYKTAAPSGCPTHADLSIAKSVTPTLAAPGETVTYTLVFSNAGAKGLAVGVVISDVIPVSVTVQSVVSGGVAITDSGASPAFVWNVEDLSAGEGGAITITGALSDLPGGHTFTNVAVITAASADSDPDNNDDAAVVAILPADLRLVKTVTPTAPVNPGGTVTYTLTFSNAGEGLAVGVVISDAIPVSVTVQSVVSGGVAITDSGASPAFVWNVEDLSAGEGGAITITVLLNIPLAQGIFSNTAAITTTSSDGDTGNNHSAAAVTVPNVAPVAKAGNDQNADPGDAVTLDGSGSSDVNGDPLTYGWVQTGGVPQMTLSDSGAISPTFTAAAAGIFTFSLTVTDTGGLTDTAVTVVTVTAYHIYLPLVPKNW